MRIVVKIYGPKFQGQFVGNVWIQDHAAENPHLRRQIKGRRPVEDIRRRRFIALGRIVLAIALLFGNHTTTPALNWAPCHSCLSNFPHSSDYVTVSENQLDLVLAKQIPQNLLAY